MRFIALILALLCSPAFAQVPMTGAGVGAPSGAAYSGPGDAQTTGWIFWVGLRAFSAATSGTKAANICNSGDANCADVNTLANGNFDVATATGTPLNCGGAGGTCTIKTLYDKSGSLSCTAACDLTQATISNRPNLVLNCTGAIPCVGFTGGTSQVLVSASLATTYAQPFSVSIIYDRTAGFTSFTDIASAGGGAAKLYASSSANQIFANTGSFAAVTVNDSALHAINGTYNNAAGTNAFNVDGTLTTVAPGASSLSASINALGNAASGAPTANIGEFGWNSLTFITTPGGNLCHNQRLYWGTGGSC